MDYSAEQEMEIEALQSILMEDFAGWNCLVRKLTSLCHFSSKHRFSNVTELDGPSPSGWSDNVKCYRIGLPTGEAESMQASGASSSEHTQLTVLLTLLA